MNLDQIFNLHEQALNLRAKRVEVLASNLANADTPGFKAKDIEFDDILAQLANGSSEGSMAVTQPAHIGLDMNDLTPYLVERAPLQTSLDGNTVDSQIESAQFAQNSMRYLTTLKLIENKVRNVLTAIRGE